MDVAELTRAHADADLGPLFTGEPASFADQTSPPVTPSSPAPALRPRRAVFAGLSAGQLLLGFMSVLALLWAVWATHKLIVVDHRRIVAVRLSALVGEFVNAEARSGDDPRNLSARTQAYMTTLDVLLKKRAATGETVIVAEAVVGESVPDITSDIAEQLSRIVKLPTVLALPPAIGPAPAPQVSPPAALQSQGLPMSSPLQPGVSSFPSAPTGVAPQQTQPQGSDPFAGAAPSGAN